MENSKYILSDVTLCGLPLYTEAGQTIDKVVETYHRLNGDNVEVLPNFTAVFFYDGYFIYQYKDAAKGFVVEIGQYLYMGDSLEYLEGEIDKSPLAKP